MSDTDTSAVRPESRTRPEWLSPMALAAAGVAAGVAAKLTDEFGPGWAADLGTYPGVWVLAAAVIGFVSPTVTSAAVRSATCLLGVLLAYYGWQNFVLGYGWGRVAYAWVALAVTLAPAGAAAVRWAAWRSGGLPGAVLAAVGSVPLTDGTVQQVWRAVTGALPEEVPLRPVQAMFNVVAVLMITAVLPRHGVTRVWALALVVPLGIVGVRLIDEAFSLLA